MDNVIQYGVVCTAAEIGALARAHRKDKNLTLERISGVGNLSTKFLSEFERGKDTAELGKVLHTLRTLGLEVIIQPRNANVHAFEVASVKQGNTPTKQDKKDR